MKRRAAAACAAACAVAVAPTAHAATVSAERAADRVCHARLLPAGTAGVARTAFTPRAPGVLSVRLTGAAGDWDLAVFDAASGRLHNAGASAGRREQAIAFAAPGRAVVAQACRRNGAGSTASVAFHLHEQAAPADPAERAMLVRVPLSGADAHRRLEATGLDVTHDAGPGGATVVLYSAAERARLLAAGFTFRTLAPSLRRVDLATARADRLYAGSIAASALPSGRDAYRTLADYQSDLKSIVDQFPSVARRIEIGKSIEGRPIEGVELSGGVSGRDGRPVYVVMGLHHAREWPSGEMPMEFALELARGYGKSERITSLLDRVRVLALPVVNPDGFNVSRTAGPTPLDDDPNSTLPLIVSDGAAYKRKNCRPAAGSEATPCISRPAAQGVDLNRNYGAYYGGVGSSDSPLMQNYRGAGPYSEPESEAVHRLSSTRSIVTIITHHTFTDEGEWLRQPGFCLREDLDCPVPSSSSNEYDPQGQIVPDEAGMRALGMAMGDATGWFSNVGWVIGEITGATEDWNYFTQGAYGYTPEQRGPNFHPSFQNAVVKEYDGTAPGADGGMREALLRAGEQAANPSFHSVLLGVAPAGRVLRLRKSFQTPTSIQGLAIDDKLDFETVVPDSGFYNWHVNQSTRPLSTAPEAYTLTCEAGGQVIESRTVVIARGETQAIDLPCGGPAIEPPTQAPSTPGQLLCADARPPVSSPTRRSLRISSGRVLVRGRASDHGCQARGGLAARRGQLARVVAAVARRVGSRCRFLRPGGGFSSVRSCSRPLYVAAEGLGSWKLKVRGDFREGRYLTWSQATDTSGNVERRRRRVLTGTLG